MSHTKQFINRAEVKAFDLEHRKKLNFNIDKYLATFEKGKNQYADLERAKQRAKNVKWKTIQHLDDHLLKFEKEFQKNGGKVIWAQDAEEARQEILKIFKEHNGKSTVKSKSMATEEIELNHFLEKNDIEVFETDLGEYIVQLAEEKPYHIVTPAMHKSKEDVAKLFHEKLNVEPNLSPPELTMIARKNLRQKYVTADIGISGANFIISETGAIAITENEGNARMTTAFPKVHIALVGIEKVIPSMDDLDVFWPLLSTHGTGQNVTVYNTLFHGPKRPNEVDGPEHMYVVLIDNGRTNILADPKLRESLYCIRCGACLNVCPVYKNIGGHAYGTTYSGPIGSVISPHMHGLDELGHLSQASSLCGNCSEVCPVKIDLHGLLNYNRNTMVKKGMTTRAERFGWSLWKSAMLSRKKMNRGGMKSKQFIVNTLFSKSWEKEEKFFNSQKKLSISFGKVNRQFESSLLNPIELRIKS